MSNKKRKKRASKKKVSATTRRANLFHEFFLLMVSLLTICLVILLSTFVFMTITTMSDDGMIFEVNRNDVLLVDKSAEIERFEIIYFKEGGSLEIRRVIGLPGDTLEYKNDSLYINKKEITEKHLDYRKSLTSGSILTEDFNLPDILGIKKIPKNHYFVLGDNRKNAIDSRHYGLVESNDILGVVSLRIMPLTNLKQY